jgi:DNA-directed RNA polymerase subunit RPC12/RpoP
MAISISQSETACASCGQRFEQPLLAELRSGSVTEEYYACPRCLTKVGEAESETGAQSEEKEEKAELPDERVPISEEKTDRTSECSFYLGYLRKRDRGAQIPEGCFTCPKMIECI